MVSKSLKFQHNLDRQSSAFINDNDVVIEILSRLPIRSLLRFKSVCKWWYKLISDPTFVYNYSHRQHPQHYVSGFYLQKFFFLEMYSNLGFITLNGQLDIAPEPSLTFIEDDRGICIQHSCNGLLLCSSFRCHDRDRVYYICKPTTKQFIVLPRLEVRTVLGINLAFDPATTRTFQYKVVCVCDSDISNNHLQIKVYSSEAGLWKISGDHFRVSDDLLFSRGVFWKGGLHWIGREEASLLRFDVEHESLLDMPIPPIPEGCHVRRLRYFGESQGHLHLIKIYGNQTTRFDVMEMKSDYSEWFLKYRVNLHLVANTVPGFFVFSVLHLVRGIGGVKEEEEEEEEEEESTLLLHIPGKFISYNLRDGTFEKLGNLSHRLATLGNHLGLQYSWENVYPYTNILCYI